MILRKALLPICLVIILVSAQSAQAEFTATFTMTSTAPDFAHVFPLTPIVVTLWDTQGYGTTPADNSITRIQLNWTNSAAALTTGSTWTWSDALSGLGLAYDDSDMSDGFVVRMNLGDEGVAPDTPFSVGTLAFTAPAYNSGGGNIHALDLNGGLVEEETMTLVACGAPAMQPEDIDGVWLMASPNGEGLTLFGYNITIVPGGYWTGATDTKWQTGTNWSSQMTPDGTFEAVFDGALTTPPALTKGEAVKSVEFRTGGWNVGGPTYTLTIGSGGITSAGATTNTIQPTVGLSADAAITVVGAAHTLQMAAISADGRSVSKEGEGTLKATDVTADVFNVNDGAAELTSLAGSGTNRTASVAAGKQFTVGTFSNLSSVTVNGTMIAGAGASSATSMSVAAGGQLELRGTTVGTTNPIGVAGTIVAAGGATSTISGGANFINGSRVTATDPLIVSAPSIAASATLTKDGTSSLTFSGTQSHGVGSKLQVTAGSAVFSTNAGTTAARNLTVQADNASTLTFDATQDLASIILNDAAVATLTAGGSKVITTSDLNINGYNITAPTAKLDLKDNDLVINYAGAADPIATIRGYLANGYKSNAWNGTGIVSSAVVSGSQTSLGSKDDTVAQTVTVKYTWVGDANLDGKVTSADYSKFVAGYRSDGAKTGWENGDFNYDGVIDVKDYSKFVAGYRKYMASPQTLGEVEELPPLPPLESLTSAVVPEPATLTLAALGAAGLLARRRRKA